MHPGGNFFPTGRVGSLMSGGMPSMLGGSGAVPISLIPTYLPTNWRRRLTMFNSTEMVSENSRYAPISVTMFCGAG